MAAADEMDVLVCFKTGTKVVSGPDLMQADPEETLAALYTRAVPADVEDRFHLLKVGICTSE